MGGVSRRLPGRRASRGRPARTGTAVTRSTATARSSGSCLRWTGWPCARSAPGSCRRTSGSRSLTCGSAGMSIRRIAARLGRAPSTVSRELRRNADRRRVTGRSRRTGGRPRAGPAVIRGGVEASEQLARAGRRTACAAVEPGADQPPAAPAVPGRPGDVAVSREHLPGCLPAGIAVNSAVAAGAAPPVAAADRTGSPPRAPARPAAASVRAADAHDPPSALRAWTAPRQGIGNLNAVVKPLGPVRVGSVPGRWCGLGAWPTAC